MGLAYARDEFIAHKRDDGRAASTLRSYKYHVDQFIHYVIHKTGRERVTSFTSATVRAYLHHREVERHLGGHTLNLDSTVLREFATWGARKRYWRHEDVDDIPSLDKPRRLARPYTDAERDAMMGLELDARDAAVRGILYYGGLRRAEVVALNLKDITAPRALPTGETIQGALFVFGKGKKERVVPIHPSLWPLLDAYLRTLPRKTLLDRPLLMHADGARWDVKAVSRRVKAWGARAEVRGVKPHKWRHTFATNYLEASPDDIRTLQELLGHENLNTTEGYTHVVSARKATGISKLPHFGTETNARDFVTPTVEPQDGVANCAERRDTS